MSQTYRIEYQFIAEVRRASRNRDGREIPGNMCHVVTIGSHVSRVDRSFRAVDATNDRRARLVGMTGESR